MHNTEKKLLTKDIQKYMSSSAENNNETFTKTLKHNYVLEAFEKSPRFIVNILHERFSCILYPFNNIFLYSFHDQIPLNCNIIKFLDAFYKSSNNIANIADTV